METHDTDLGRTFFEWRDYTPLPLVFLLFLMAHPTVGSATLGTLLIIFGELWRIYAVSFIGAISRTRSEALGDALIDQGPFQWMRNPLYVGNFLIILGFCIYAHHTFLTLLALGFFAFQYHHITLYEETLLEKKFGEAYQKYREDVPKWLPKKWPYLSDMPWPESFAPAIKSEKPTLISIVAILVLLLMI